MNDSGSEAREEGAAQADGDPRAAAERLRQERRARVLARHPRIGWLLLALAGAQAYEEGAPGGGVGGADAGRDGRAESEKRGWRRFGRGRSEPPRGLL
jgi:hypothetical protein